MPIFNPAPAVALADDVPPDQAIGDTAVLGTSEEAARENHKHGMPAEITRVQLEYPTVDVTLAYLEVRKKAEPKRDVWFDPDTNYGLVSIDTFADKAIESLGRAYAGNVARYSGYQNTYATTVYIPAATADFKLEKKVANVYTELGAEAVDLDDRYHLTKFSASGSTLNAFREDLVTPKISVIDTSFTSGKIGAYHRWDYPSGLQFYAYLRAPSSPAAPIVGFFEVPIIGSGTSDDPFRADLPTELAWEWPLNPEAEKKYNVLRPKGFSDEEIEILAPEIAACRVNCLAVTYSALIPSNPDGKPKSSTAVIRIYESSPRYIRSMRKRLDAIRAVPGVRELTPDEAKRRVRELDDKLSDGEAENFINPNEENEIDGIADFYERELRLGRLKLEQLPTLEEDIKRYAEKAKSLGRTKAERRFKRLMS